MRLDRFSMKWKLAIGAVRGVFGLISDVTRLKEAEARLAREHDRLAATIEGTNAGTWEWNIATGEARVNARWGEILGHTLDELAPVTIETWTSRTHPDDREVINARLREHFAGTRDHHEFEARMRHKDGSWIWVLGYGRVSERDAAGKALMMHGVHLDISARKSAEEALRFSQQALQRTSDVAGVGGWELDLATREVTWSDATCRLHDLAPGHRPDLASVIAFYEPEARPLIEAAVRQGIEHGTSWDLELPLRSATGRPFWARVVGAVEFENDVAVRLVGSFQDVTARKAIEHQLVEHRELLQTTLDSIGDAVITTDTRGMIRWLNPVAERMTGWTRAEAAGQPLNRVFVIVDEETRLAAPDPVAACISQGKIVGLAGKTMLLSRDGSEFGIDDSASPIVDASGKVYGVVLVFRDVSEQRRLSYEMTHRATHDPLTGLVNRAEFEARLDRLASTLQLDERGNSLMFIDLDRFKIVNDACGHTVGDQLLKQVSGMMRDCVRSRDTVARLGGDEFGIILEHCDVAQAQVIAQKLCDQMEDFRFTHDGRRFRVGTSIGLVPFDCRWPTVAAAMQAADASCYAAKQAGRSRVYLWVDSDASITSRHGDMQWVSRLELALDENRFELYGQRIEAVSGASDGLHCEVLLRLVEPDGTIVLPGAFLPAAERFHLATRIDRWVVREVFSRMETDPGFEQQIGTIAVNLSGHSIGDRAFHRTVIELIRAASFDVSKLCFEITETVAVTNFSDAKAFIEEVRAMGVKVSLDDFGAGASSFGYLKHLPVDYLKIDGQFVTGLLDDALDDAAVRCFRDVAQVVGVATIAEFVEREDVREQLGAIGIDMAQGFLIHRPEPLRSLALQFA
jgi:diguanylate cyclase (GGDEF)-like protein/PAS domain S-box-containing protein